MNVSQLRLVGVVAITIAAVCVWVWSYSYFPAGGLIRSALLFGLIALLWRPFNTDLKRTMLELPLERSLAFAVFFCWLVVLLIAILAAHSLNFEVPTKGAGAQIGILVFLAPVWFYFSFIVVRVYQGLGRIGT